MPVSLPSPHLLLQPHQARHRLPPRRDHHRVRASPRGARGGWPEIAETAVTCFAITLVGLAIGFVLLRVEAAVEGEE